MIDALRRRGPDGERIQIERGFALGHTRLSIIDIEGGAQPMSDDTGAVSLVFNGEIYNYRELRSQLEARGRAFRTQSDTESILHAYLEWGIDFLDRIVGMFAIAIWDDRSEELFLLRDRLGVKPLYWLELGGQQGIAFASEVSALLQSGLSSRRLNRTAVCNYVALSYIPGDDSIIEGLHRLPPATMLRWKRGEAHTLRRYWDLAAIWGNAHPAVQNESDVEAEFLARLEKATTRRLVSDVPLGALLSGGIDSSVVCALAAKSKERLITFSVGFSEATFDELPYARAMAKFLDAEHHDSVVSCDSPDLLLEVAGRLDEPFADTSILPTYVLCRTARSRLTVALSGDGGDELLAGYTTHTADALLRTIGWLPPSALRVAERLAALIPDTRSKVGAVFKLKQFLRGASLDSASAHASWRMLAVFDGLRELINPDFWSRDTDPFGPALAADREAQGLSPLDKALYVDYKTWLPDDILTKADRASMAHGLEVRSPFLDHELVEYCAGLPSRFKMRGLQRKYLLKRVASHLIPRDIVRRPKRGFNAPVSHWIPGPWRELSNDVLSKSALQAGSVFNADAVGRRLREHVTGQHDHGFLLFCILMLCLWQQQHKL